VSNFGATPTFYEKNFRVNRASQGEATWLRNTFNWEGKRFGTRVELDGDKSLILHWQ
jgi:poly-gamma-glutamate synthesis protein (capsule biosynthesis protein)